MDYFVSIENNAYYNWQLELLIESFKYNSLENNLLVGLIQSNNNYTPFDFFNASEHTRKYFYENIGDAKGYKNLSHLYCLVSLQNLINQPFTIISPDMVLRKPINPELKSDRPQIIFAPDLRFTFDYVQKNVPDFFQELNHDESFYRKNWIPLGSCTIFNNIPEYFFANVLMLTEKLAVQQILNGQNIWKYTDKLAWSIMLADYHENIETTGDYQITDTMINNSQSPIIHYEHGLSPNFNKLQFLYEPPLYISCGDPFEILKDSKSTSNAHYMSVLAENYLKKRK